MNYQLKLNQL